MDLICSTVKFTYKRCFAMLRTIWSANDQTRRIPEQPRSNDNGNNRNIVSETVNHNSGRKYTMANARLVFLEGHSSFRASPSTEENFQGQRRGGRLASTRDMVKWKLSHNIALSLLVHNRGSSWNSCAPTTKGSSTRNPPPWKRVGIIFFLD